MLRVVTWLEGALTYPDELPPTGITLDAMAIFPFGTAGEKLDQQGLALCRRAGELAKTHRPKLIYTMGGWRANTGLPTEGRLYSEILAKRLEEHNLRIEIDAEERTENTRQQVDYLCRRIPPQREGLLPYTILVMAQTYHCRRVRMLMRRFAPQGSVIFVASAGHPTWGDNAKPQLRHKEYYLGYECLALAWDNALTLEHKKWHNSHPQQR